MHIIPFHFCEVSFQTATGDNISVIPSLSPVAPAGGITCVNNLLSRLPVCVSHYQQPAAGEHLCLDSSPPAVLAWRAKPHRACLELQKARGAHRAGTAL